MKDEKEEIKPAPLGEQKKDYTDADVAFANSYQRDNKHYIQRESLGESSEEQKPLKLAIIGAGKPTSEPPEEQEELWFEAFTEAPVRLHPKTEEYLKKNFIISRR